MGLQVSVLLAAFPFARKDVSGHKGRVSAAAVFALSRAGTAACPAVGTVIVIINITVSGRWLQ
jgi:hypothetical protein